MHKNMLDRPTGVGIIRTMLQRNIAATEAMLMQSTLSKEI